MKVAKLYSIDDIRIEETPVPPVGPGDVLIKTHACGVCSGDAMPWYIERKAPVVPGHEPVGEIVETGKGVTYFKEGDRIFAHHHAPCFTCKFCRRGDYVQCATWRDSHLVPGGISEYILIPSINLENDTLVLPENLSDEDGTFIEPSACVVKGLKRARIRSDDTVLILGLGVMGILNMLIAREYGAGKIIGADRVKFRLDKALELGADYVIDVTSRALHEGLRDVTGGEMAELVIVGPNSAEAMREGLACVRPGGQVLFFAPAKPGERLTIDPNALYFRDINIITSYSCGPADTADACELIEKGVVSAERLVSHRFPIDRTAEAFALTAKAEDSMKSLIVFGD